MTTMLTFCSQCQYVSVFFLFEKNEGCFWKLHPVVNKKVFLLCTFSVECHWNPCIIKKYSKCSKLLHQCRMVRSKCSPDYIFSSRVLVCVKAKVLFCCGHSHSAQDMALHGKLCEFPTSEWLCSLFMPWFSDSPQISWFNSFWFNLV